MKSAKISPLRLLGQRGRQADEFAVFGRANDIARMAPANSIWPARNKSPWGALKVGVNYKRCGDRSSHRQTQEPAMKTLLISLLAISTLAAAAPASAHHHWHHWRHHHHHHHHWH